MNRTAHDGLSVRALVAGVGFGLPLLISNIYMSVKTGWADSSNLIAALVVFLTFGALRPLLKHPLGIHENNVAQTTASAMCFGGSILSVDGAYAAAVMLGAQVSTTVYVAWGLALAIATTALGLWFRRSALTDRTLFFPTGQATAALLRGIHREQSDREGAEPQTQAKRQGRALLFGTGSGGLTTLFRNPPLGWLPERIAAPGAWGAIHSPVGAELSMLSFGIGALAGPRLALSWALGGAFCWLALVPWVERQFGIQFSDFTDCARWTAWPAAGLGLGATLGPLLRNRGILQRAGTDVKRLSSRPPGPSDLEPLPRKGVRAVVGMGVAAGTLVFAISVWGLGIPLLGVVLAFACVVPLVAISVRAAGETDTVMVGLAQQVTQGGLGVVARVPPAPNALGSGIVGGACLQAANVFWCLKSGQLLAARGFGQVVGYFLGTSIGALLAMPIFLVVTRGTPIGSEGAPAPGAQFIRTFAEVFGSGASALPPGTLWAAAIAFAAGLAVSLPKDPRWLPSATAVSIGFVTPLPFAVTVALGGVLGALSMRGRRAIAPELLTMGASGCIIGESLTGSAFMLLSGTGILDP